MAAFSLPKFRVSASSTLASGSALGRGAAGAFRVTVEAAQFERALRRFAGRVRVKAGDLLRTHALDLQARVQARTPVKTGRLKNSIHVVLPGTTDGAHAYGDHEGRTFDGSTGLVAGPQEAYVASNVIYGPAIEAGHSRQAPAGMFGVSLREKTGALLDAAGEAMTDAWDESGDA